MSYFLSKRTTRHARAGVVRNAGDTRRGLVTGERLSAVNTLFAPAGTTTMVDPGIRPRLRPPIEFAAGMAVPAPRQVSSFRTRERMQPPIDAGAAGGKKPGWPGGVPPAYPRAHAGRGGATPDPADWNFFWSLHG